MLNPQALQLRVGVDVGLYEPIYVKVVYLAGASWFLLFLQLTCVERVHW